MDASRSVEILFVLIFIDPNSDSAIVSILFLLFTGFRSGAAAYPSSHLESPMGHFVHHKVVSTPRQLRLPLTCRSDLLLEPEIKNVTQVDIGYDPPDCPPLWRSFFRSR